MFVAAAAIAAAMLSGGAANACKGSSAIGTVQSTVGADPSGGTVYSNLNLAGSTAQGGIDTVAATAGQGNPAAHAVC
jgi:hypothetical protein